MTKLVAAVALAVTLTTSQCQAPAKKPAPSKTCHEGDSCWNCHTMGNKRCGPSDPGKL